MSSGILKRISQRQRAAQTLDTMANLIRVLDLRVSELEIAVTALTIAVRDLHQLTDTQVTRYRRDAEQKLNRR